MFKPKKHPKGLLGKVLFTNITKNTANEIRATFEREKRLIILPLALIISTKLS